MEYTTGHKKTSAGLAALFALSLPVVSRWGTPNQTEQVTSATKRSKLSSKMLLPKDGEGTTILNDPSASGRVKLSTAQVVRMKPGDIIIIPPDVCHHWMGITDDVDYLSVRPDPDRVLPVGYINPAIKK